ncbi:uncharacterized protein LOC106164629 [Lingula anatina]|uniref:Uncharacterized protein LOC106164629 n=1 Tax=Lingula anatina TaxID=7574 RepID=A0A1S3III5_LINAN|nr:uncharacterized protein LOC106164629 [Lingula anatina]|eukprot:XP_013398050.1 uncharacterized protein LOC106164629 [Lingula anatina]
MVMMSGTVGRTNVLITITAVLSVCTLSWTRINSQEIDNLTTQCKNYQDLTPLLIHLQAISQLLSAQNMQLNAQNGLLRLLQQQLSSHSSTTEHISQNSNADMAAIQKHVLLVEERLGITLKQLNADMMMSFEILEEKLNKTLSLNINRNKNIIKPIGNTEYPTSFKGGQESCVSVCTKTPVFHVESEHGQYKLTFAKAQAQCELLGATIATPIQLQAAHDDGLDVCRWGWVSDGTLRMPIRYPRPGCADEESRAVVVADARNATSVVPLNGLADVFCFRLQI